MLSNTYGWDSVSWSSLATPVTATYTAQGTDGGTEITTTVNSPPIRGRISTVYPIIPGTLELTAPGGVYRDDGRGNLLDPTDNATAVGTVDYDDGDVVLQPITFGDMAITASFIAAETLWGVHEITAKAPAAPLRAGSASIAAERIDGVNILSASNTEGSWSGDDTSGDIDYETGVLTINFGLDGEGNPQAVWPDSLLFNGVVLTYLPQDADIIGVDAVRLPVDGKVEIFRPGSFLVLHDEATHTEAGLAPSGSFVVAHNNISGVSAVDSGGTPLIVARSGSETGGEHLIYQEVTGGFTVPATADFTGLSGPYTITYTYDDWAVASSVDISGSIALGRPLDNAYSAATAKLSSVIDFGDVGARVVNVRDIQTWSGDYDPDGVTVASGSFDTLNYPFVVANDGAITEDWALVFRSSTEVEVFGSTIGGKGLWPIASPVAPINPATGTPYFTVPSGGWGSGWSAGNAVLFSTVGGQRPFWVARVVLPGAMSHAEDSVKLAIRGNPAE